MIEREKLLLESIGGETVEKMEEFMATMLAQRQEDAKFRESILAELKMTHAEMLKRK